MSWFLPLYFQNFTTEQDRLQPPDGWKVHYSATKAVTEANQNFYTVFSSKSLFGMAALWLNADYVKCIHPGGMLLTGYGLPTHPFAGSHSASSIGLSVLSTA